jgi:hypothetical protein
VPNCELIVGMDLNPFKRKYYDPVGVPELGMVIPHYSSRNRTSILTLADVYFRLNSLFELYRSKDYFRQKTGLTYNYFPSSLTHDAVAVLGFSALPVSKWSGAHIEEDNILNTFEFLYDRVSKPGKYVWMTDEANGSYQDFESYDEAAGRAEFRDAANLILRDWKDGFQLDADGRIETLGSGGLQYILSADIVPFDEVNVDSKVRLAITKYRGRHATLSDKKEAVRIMADVFEFLKKSQELKIALDKSDSSDLFNIANNFAIRHHNPDQKGNYDGGIWYAWMFHFYLATYHAAVRQIQKNKTKAKP